MTADPSPTVTEAPVPLLACRGISQFEGLGGSRSCAERLRGTERFCPNCGRPLVALTLDEEKGPDDVPWIYIDRRALVAEGNPRAGLQIHVRNVVDDARGSALSQLVIWGARFQSAGHYVLPANAATASGEVAPEFPIVVPPGESSKLPIALPPIRDDEPPRVDQLIIDSSAGTISRRVRLINHANVVVLYDTKEDGERPLFYESDQAPPAVMDLDVVIRPKPGAEIFVTRIDMAAVRVIKSVGDERLPRGTSVLPFQGDADRLARVRLRVRGAPGTGKEVLLPLRVSAGEEIAFSAPLQVSGWKPDAPQVVRPVLSGVGLGKEGAAALNIDERRPLLLLRLQKRGRLRFNPPQLTFQDGRETLRLGERNRRPRPSQFHTPGSSLTFHPDCPLVRQVVEIQNDGQQDLLVRIESRSPALTVDVQGLNDQGLMLLPGRSLEGDRSQPLRFTASLNLEHESVQVGRSFRGELHAMGRNAGDEGDLSLLASLPVHTPDVREPPDADGMVAVDFGTSYTCVQISQSSTPTGKPELLELANATSIPTLIFFDDVSDPDRPRVLIGEEAARAAERHKEMPACLARGFKRSLGTTPKHHVMDRTRQSAFYTAQQLTEIFLGKLYDELTLAINSRARKIVVTRPLAFAWAQNLELERAFRRAFRPASERRPLSEPLEQPSGDDPTEILADFDEATSVAAQYVKYESADLGAAAAVPRPEGDYRLVVFDFGGGTLDILLGVVSKHGDNQGRPLRRLTLLEFIGLRRFGGEDVTELLMERLRTWIGPHEELQLPRLPMVHPTRRGSGHREVELENGQVVYDKVNDLKLAVSRQYEISPEQADNGHSRPFPELRWADNTPVQLSQEWGLAARDIKDVLDGPLENVLRRIAQGLSAAKARPHEHLPLVCLLTGQSSRLPGVRGAFERFFPDAIVPVGFVGSKESVAQGALAAYQVFGDSDFETEPNVCRVKMLALPLVLNNIGAPIELVPQFTELRDEGSDTRPTDWRRVPPAGRLSLEVQERHADRLDLQGGTFEIARSVFPPQIVRFGPKHRAGNYSIRVVPFGEYKHAPHEIDERRLERVTLRVTVKWTAHGREDCDWNDPAHEVIYDESHEYQIRPLSVEQLGDRHYA